MISLNNVTFAYDKKSNPVFENFNLSVSQGEFLSVIGNSGCGKSTLLRLVSGLDLPQQGAISINGVEVTKPSIERSIVFQHYSLFPWLTVRENIIFSLKKSKKIAPKKLEQRANYYLQKVGLSDSSNKYPFQLSGGMRQRTAIARTLALDSSIMLFDEPFGALDTKIRGELQSFLRNIWEEDRSKTIIFITHDLDEALNLSSRIVFIRKGILLKDIKINQEIHCCRRDRMNLDHCIELKEQLESLYE